MHHWRRWLLLIAAVVAAIFYIYPPGRIELNRRRADGESALRCIENVRGDIKLAPAGPDNDTTPLLPRGSDISPGNTLALHAEDLADLAEERPTPLRFCANHARSAASLIRTNKWPDGSKLGLMDTPGFIDNLVDELKGFKYVIVIRKRSYMAPVPTTGMDFDAGYYTADVLLFQLEPRRLVGGFPISATNSTFFNSHESSARAALVADLAEHARKDLEGELGRRVRIFENLPQSITPPCSI